MARFVLISTVIYTVVILFWFTCAPLPHGLQHTPLLIPPFPPYPPSASARTHFLALNVAIALVPLHHVRVAQGPTKDVQGAANRQVHLFYFNQLVN